jgi:hypothetical protein
MKYRVVLAEGRGRWSTDFLDAVSPPEALRQRLSRAGALVPRHGLAKVQEVRRTETHWGLVDVGRPTFFRWWRAAPDSAVFLFSRRSPDRVGGKILGM